MSLMFPYITFRSLDGIDEMQVLNTVRRRRPTDRFTSPPKLLKFERDGHRFIPHFKQKNLALDFDRIDRANVADPADLAAANVSDPADLAAANVSDPANLAGPSDQSLETNQDPVVDFDRIDLAPDQNIDPADQAKAGFHVAQVHI